MEKYSQQTAKRKKEAAETSLDRIRRSIEGALEKEKKCVEQEAVNQYIRDASIRMSLNLPIKPVKVIPKEQPQKDKSHYHGDNKLPSLQHGEKSPIKKNDEHMLNNENTAGQIKLSNQLHSPRGSQSSVKLPPIIIDTGQRETIGKRKRKKDQDIGQQIVRKSPKQNLTNLTKNRLESESPCEEELSVVMCGRSPMIQGREKELFVSKHGRFKSK